MKEKGEWDDTVAGLARDNAYFSVMRNLGPDGIREVMGCLKLDETGVAGRVHGMIEAFLATNSEHP
jgi:hypothetical protein